MRVSFGRFELDAQARTLVLDGREQALQPLVFDLLVHLVRHRDRVVSKEDLLSNLWAGTVVTDGSLQRAVSLLRGALRDGGLPEAVQTFARRGYRFAAPIGGELEAAVPPHAGGSGPRALSDAGQWDRALEAFEAVPDDGTLSADDLEAWGTAAVCAGRLERSVVPLERAVAAFEERSEPESAARAALMLCNVKLEVRELAIARGWHERARRFLDGLPPGKQHGMAAWLESRLAMFDGQLDESLAHAVRAKKIGDDLGDPDVQCLGLVYHGHLLIARGEVREGLAMHDEAGAAALSGRAGTFAAGIVFCSIILVYVHLGDSHRAGQWIDQFTRWCERNAAYNYPAICRLHRGEGLAARGDLGSAESEVRLAQQELAHSAPYIEGDAHRVLGEILLSRGDLDGAEVSFREAHRLGWTPQPGLSLLLAAKGHAGDGVRQLERALSEPRWTNGQRRGLLLAILARLAATEGQIERARAALDELAASAERCNTNACAAERARAEGEILVSAGDVSGAESRFRAAISLWLNAGARLQAAEIRLRLCELLMGLGDRTAAELELASAESVFTEIRATRVLGTCAKLRERLRAAS